MFFVCLFFFQFSILKNSAQTGVDFITIQRKVLWTWMIYILNFLYLKISHLYRYIEYKSHKGTYIRFCTIFLSTAFLLLTPILNKICCYFIRYLLLGFGNTIHVLSKYQVNLIFFSIKILETKYRKWQ